MVSKTVPRGSSGSGGVNTYTINFPSGISVDASKTIAILDTYRTASAMSYTTDCCITGISPKSVTFTVSSYNMSTGSDDNVNCKVQVIEFY